MATMASYHFALSEFEKDAPVPPEYYPILGELCMNILEPVREAFGPLLITSGYRPEADNVAAHGIKDSEHIYSPAHAAGDFKSPTVPARVIFDWMRNNPKLPYHQLILEHDAKGASVVHVSINRLMVGVRSVLEGATHNAEPYTKVDHVAFEV